MLADERSGMSIGLDVTQRRHFSQAKGSARLLPLGDASRNLVSTNQHHQPPSASARWLRRAARSDDVDLVPLTWCSGLHTPV